MSHRLVVRTFRYAVYFRASDKVVTVLESLRRDLVALERAGAVSEATMRRFDVICPPPET